MQDTNSYMDAMSGSDGYRQATMPTGVPDPYNPGFDTGGFPLGYTDPGQGEPIAPIPDGRSQTPGRAAVPGTPGGPAEPGPGPADPGGPIGGALAPFGEAAPAFPTMDRFEPSTFTAPSFEDALNNPGYQFAVAQGRDQLQNWAAARGTLNDSGTAKALEDYGQAAGAQGYGQVYARNFQDWQANEQTREKAYGMNRQTQSIDPWTAAYNAWAQRGNFYLQNQGTVANTALGFGSMI